MDYTKHLAETPQTEPMIGEDQIENDAGGYVYKIDGMQQFERFLILGSEGGTYYVNERTHTIRNVKCLDGLLKTQGPAVVKRIVDISDSGRAPKNDPAIFALAYAASKGDDVTRKMALEALPKVCRIGTHLFHFAQYVNTLRGWGRGVRRAVAKWYTDRDPMNLAFQLFKYKQRDGWSHRDLLRLTHAKAKSDAQDALFGHAVGKAKDVPDEAGAWVSAVLSLPTLEKPEQVADVVGKYGLPREVIPTEMLNHAVVWEAMLPKMPPHALIRNLATMTRVGVLKPLSNGNRAVLDKINDHERLCKARLHPIAVLSALRTYARGHGERGGNEWTPVPQVCDALEEAFYGTFKSVEPCGKGVILALDVSGSMGLGTIAGVPGLSPREASAALALVTARTEPDYHILGYARDLVRFDITAKMRLNDVQRLVSNLPFGGTDTSLPWRWALRDKIKAGLVVSYTDNETWAGRQHTSAAVREYRRKMGIPARSVVVGMTATECSINDPNDALSLDIAGFDAACPQVIADFAR